MNPFSRNTSKPASRKAIQQQRARIRKLCSMPVVGSDGRVSTIKVPDDRFISSSKVRGVHFILCALDAVYGEDLTVVNCVMGPSSVIPKHAHPSTEDVFVISGSVRETVTGKEYHKGESLTIEPNDPHEFSSDYALLTMSWKPALESEYLEHYEDVDSSEDPFNSDNCKKVLLDKS